MLMLVAVAAWNIHQQFFVGRYSFWSTTSIVLPAEIGNSSAGTTSNTFSTVLPASGNASNAFSAVLPASGNAYAAALPWTGCGTQWNFDDAPNSDLGLVLATPEQEQSRAAFLDAISPQEGLYLYQTLAFSRWRMGPHGAESLAHELWDWRLEETGSNHRTRRSGNQSGIQNPRSVMCKWGGKKYITACWQMVMHLPKLGPDETRVLGFLQGDRPTLRENRFNLTSLFLDSGKFSLVVLETKDMWHSKIRALPQLMNDMYVAFLGVETDKEKHALMGLRGAVKHMPPAWVDRAYNEGDAFIRSMIESASFSKKKYGVLAAWGAVWKKLDKKLPSRMEALRFVRKSCLVNRATFKPRDYFTALQEHRFLLAPTGNSIFSPKQVEALLMLTIPIVQRRAPSEKSNTTTSAWDEAVKCYGWPMVIVDRWDEITQEALERWWKELSPRLQAARSNFLARKWFANSMGDGPESRSIECRALARSRRDAPAGTSWVTQPTAESGRDKD